MNAHSGIDLVVPRSSFIVDGTCLTVRDEMMWSIELVALDLLQALREDKPPMIIIAERAAPPGGQFGSESDQQNRAECPAHQEDKTQTYKLSTQESSPIVIRRKVGFNRGKSSRTLGAYLFVLNSIHSLLHSNVTSTKREIFYQNPQLFRAQVVVDKIVDDLTCLFRVPRSCLNVTASPKGLCAGNLILTRRDGSRIDLSVDLDQGVLVPVVANLATDADKIQCNAQWVLVIEKEATFRYLMQLKIFEWFGGGILGKGFPDQATSLFVNFLNVHVPAIRSFMCLTDCDPFGIHIYMTYRSGSQNMSFDSERLCTPSLQWMGVKWKDLYRDELPEHVYLPLTQYDRQRGLYLLSDHRLRRAEYKEISRNLCYMMFSNVKAEIQSLGTIESFAKENGYVWNKIREQVCKP
ncbi:Spo11/DNA topoisomerase VI subunit A [Paraphysoderma sedebokerense]|nr:Spo11/DNA topoisomerase VI subunit A [Paraphysoderma sedebokerense]